MRRPYDRYDGLSDSDSDEELGGSARARRAGSPARVRGGGRRTNSQRGTPVSDRSRSPTRRSGSRSPTRRARSRSPVRGRVDDDSIDERSQWVLEHVQDEFREALYHYHTDLVTIFMEFDRNQDGYLTRQELQRGLQRLDIHLSPVEMSRLMDMLDVNGDDAIDWQEFLELVEVQRGGPPTRRRRLKVDIGDRRGTKAGRRVTISPDRHARQIPPVRISHPERAVNSMLKAHACCECTWIMLTLLLGFNFWPAMLVAWDLFPLDGHCPEPLACGSGAAWFVSLGVWQPLLTVLGLVGMLASRMPGVPRVAPACGRQVHLQHLASSVYWLGCVTGLIVVVAQLVLVLGGTSGLLTDLNNVVPSITGTSTSATLGSEASYVTVSVNQARAQRRALQENTRVAGMCAGNTDTIAEPDFVCPSPSLPRDSWYEIQGRDVDTCCGCDVGIRDFADGQCVLTSDTSETPAMSENECTHVMRYAACGTDQEVAACVADPSSTACAGCAQEYPYNAFTHIADVDANRAQALCMGADLYGCSFIFKHNAARASCIDDRCAGNTAVGVDDIPCSAPATLVHGAKDLQGRDEATCCHVSGMCTGNTDTASEPDFVCVEPGVMRADADLIIGRDADACCVTTGMCIGNTEPDQDDITCSGIEVLKAEASLIEGRDAPSCCRVTGMCIGNSDLDAEADITCPGLGHIMPDAAQIRGRQYNSCCYVTGICIGNTDTTAEPDIVCADPRAGLIDAADETEGRDESSCCEIAGYCTGNSDPASDFVCASPEQLVANSFDERTHGTRTELTRSEVCCEVVGRCAGNTNALTEPDIECVAPSMLISDPIDAIGRGDECCTCGEHVLSHAQCVLEADRATDIDNHCTRVMLYASCGSDETILACAANPESDLACSGCADPSFQGFYDRAAGDQTQMGSGLTTQELCMEGQLYSCRYEFNTFLEQCTARALPPGPLPPPPPRTAPTPTPTEVAGVHYVSPEELSEFAQVCTCETEDVARLFDISWDVGLSDSFVFLTFDIMLLSLLRAAGIYYVIGRSAIV